MVATPLARAALEATRETALPRLLAMLCVLAVFIPAFFMVGAAKALFTPLALAVGFAHPHAHGAALLDDDKRRQAMSAAGLAFAETHRGATARCMALIEPLLRSRIEGAAGGHR